MSNVTYLTKFLLLNAALPNSINEILLAAVPNLMLPENKKKHPRPMAKPSHCPTPLVLGLGGFGAVIYGNAAQGPLHPPAVPQWSLGLEVGHRVLSTSPFFGQGH